MDVIAAAMADQVVVIVMKDMQAAHVRITTVPDLTTQTALTVVAASNQERTVPGMKPGQRIEVAQTPNVVSSPAVVARHQNLRAHHRIVPIKALRQI